MISVELIEQLANKHLEGSPNYLVEVKISRTNKISVSIDNDHGGIKIVDCVELSRFIEGSLDRDKEDFELEVSSHGIGQPLKLFRQYKKNIGRVVSVTISDGKKIEGQLQNATPNEITVEEEYKDSTTKKKALRSVTIPFTDIKQTIVTFKFK